MRSRLIPLCFLLFVCLAPSFGQDPKPECPKINIYGPAGFPQPNDIVTYSVRLGNGAERYALKYHWSTSSGEIVSGQGTATVEIKWPQETSLTVTVDIKGLPPNCPSTVSEHATWDPTPEAFRVGLIGSFEGHDHEQVLKKFANELQLDPSSQGYVIIGSKPETNPTEIQAREKRILDYLKGLPGHDPQRLTLVRWGGQVDIVELWRIPPGAENPTCKDCDTQLQCPKITVTGPAGIIQPEDTATFATNVDDAQKVGPLQYKWTVTGGEIRKGQGTTAIEVKARSGWPVQLNATVQVLGLPQGCAETASERVEFEIGPQPFLLDEFGKRPKADIETRLRKFFAELANNANNQGYIINYGTNKEIAVRERLIAKYVAFRNFDRSRITMVRGGRHESGTVYTKLYRAPPGAENPAP